MLDGLVLTEPIDVDVSKDTLLLIKRFLEDHNYDHSQIKVVMPLVGNDPKIHLDEKTYNLLKQYQDSSSVDKLKPLMEACYYLDMEELKNACLCMIATQFYVGATENELESFVERHGLKELSPEEELEIMKEF